MLISYYVAKIVKFQDKQTNILFFCKGANKKASRAGQLAFVVSVG